METSPNKVCQLSDLTVAILLRNDSKDALVVRAGEQLNLTDLHEGLYSLEKLRALFLKPIQEDSRVMEGYLDAGMPCENVEERFVGSFVRRSKNEIKVSNRLVIVNGEKKVYCFQWQHTFIF